MTLIKSISGIRGTIGGQQGDNLTPIDLVKFTSAYGRWLREEYTGKRLAVVIGRDARISGEMAASIVEGTLCGCGIDVVDIGLATTPTVEMAVPARGADGGIILTASHNPKQWNALKLLNRKGEFLSGAEGAQILAYADSGDMVYPGVDSIGHVISRGSFDEEHIEAVLDLSLVDVEAVRAAGFKVVVDAVNSIGGVVIPALLRRMGVEVVELYCTPNGQFPHNPEPLPENLTEISSLVVREGADLGIVVDPDVDRLALVCEDGSMFGEEYTLVAVADYVLGARMSAEAAAGGGPESRASAEAAEAAGEAGASNTVSNLSSSRALADVTHAHGGEYFAAAVGEVNVVAKMKEVGAVIGGEGNGGVIYPELHYGRDALVGVALFLTYLARSGKKASAMRAGYPQYYISKNKIELTPEIDVDGILLKVKQKYSAEAAGLGVKVNDIDGVKIDFPSEWVHLRKSNTEPIIRIYSESKDKDSADALAEKIIADIRGLI